MREADRWIAGYLIVGVISNYFFCLSMWRESREWAEWILMANLVTAGLWPFMLPYAVADEIRMHMYEPKHRQEPA